jgi:hypothetical protein
MKIEEESPKTPGLSGHIVVSLSPKEIESLLNGESLNVHSEETGFGVTIYMPSDVIPVEITEKEPIFSDQDIEQVAADVKRRCR